MFKQKFKYYRKKIPSPDLSTVLDIRTGDPELLTKLKSPCQNDINHHIDTLGLRNLTEWEIYELKSCPGLIFIVNPFTNLGQRYWIARSVADYSRKPSVTNIDNQDDVQRILDGRTWWDVASRRDGGKSVRKKLRWATMGYHHNWDTKVNLLNTVYARLRKSRDFLLILELEYSEETRSAFPNDLSQLSKLIVKAVLNLDFNPEASIVNYYLMDSFLSGHVDRSERNVEAPLVSFSFGQTAIFLVGGRSLDENPEAVFLESGDVVLMVGGSRFRYHGVPRIIPARRQPWKELRQDQKISSVINDYCRIGRSPYDGADGVTWDLVQNEEFWLLLDDYLNGARINLNVRQVI